MHVPYFMCSKLYVNCDNGKILFLSHREYNALSMHNCVPTRENLVLPEFFRFSRSPDTIRWASVSTSFVHSISCSCRLFTGTSSHIIYLPHLFCLCRENSWCVSFKVSALWLKRAANKGDLTALILISYRNNGKEEWNCSLFSVKRLNLKFVIVFAIDLLGSHSPHLIVGNGSMAKPENILNYSEILALARIRQWITHSCIHCTDPHTEWESIRKKFLRRV